MIVYISIGNSDDKLTQARWAEFYAATWYAMNQCHGTQLHGEWMSSPSAKFQNACWCVEVTDQGVIRAMKGQLRTIAAAYGQDSIAWAEAPTTEFLGADDGR